MIFTNLQRTNDNKTHNGIRTRFTRIGLAFGKGSIRQKHLDKYDINTEQGYNDLVNIYGRNTVDKKLAEQDQQNNRTVNTDTTPKEMPTPLQSSSASEVIAIDDVDSGISVESDSEITVKTSNVNDTNTNGNTEFNQAALDDAVSFSLDVLEKLQEEDEKKTNAATTIQSAYRGFKTKQKKTTSISNNDHGIDPEFGIQVLEPFPLKTVEKFYNALETEGIQLWLRNEEDKAFKSEVTKRPKASVTDSSDKSQALSVPAKTQTILSIDLLQVPIIAFIQSAEDEKKK